MAANLNYRASLHRRALSRFVRRWHAATGASASDLAAVAGWSNGKMSLLFNACQAMSEADFLTLAMIFKVDPALRDRGLLSARASGARQDGLPWTLAELEAEAAELRIVAGELVPPLFRTAAYDTAVRAAQVAGGEPAYSADQREATLRQLSAAVPLRVHLVLGEGAVRRMVGGERVMTDQSLWLARLAELSNVTVQVQPDSGGAYAGIGYGFTWMSFVERQFDDVVHVPQLREPIWVEAADEVDRHEQTFAAAAKTALAEDASIALILDGLPRTS